MTPTEKIAELRKIDIDDIDFQDFVNLLDIAEAAIEAADMMAAVDFHTTKQNGYIPGVTWKCRIDLDDALAKLGSEE